MDYVALKLSIEASTSLSQDALHIFAAVAIQFLVAAISRKGAAHPIPWLCVLLAEVVNEWLDFAQYPFPSGTLESMHDITNTMFLPTLILLLGQVAPWLLRPAVNPRR